MRDIINKIVTSLVITFFILIFLFGVGSIIDSNQCYAMTENIGYNVEFGLWSGCLIEIEPGRWIPIENYQFREGIQPTPQPSPVP